MSIDQLISPFGLLSRTLLVGSSLAVALSFGCGDKAATSYSGASDEKNSQPKEECFIPGQSGQMTTMMIPKYTYDESGKLTGVIGKGGQSTEYTLNIYKKIPCVTPNFVNNNDGTITDRAHGLMWTIEATPDERSLGGAVEACKNVKNAGGYSDWRVPTIEELWTLWTEETPCHFPSIFQGKCWRYWTSTPAPAGWTDNYFAVYFESSYPMLQAVRYQGNWMPSTVRCVRSVVSTDTSQKNSNQVDEIFKDMFKIGRGISSIRDCRALRGKTTPFVDYEHGKVMDALRECYLKLLRKSICPPYIMSVDIKWESQGKPKQLEGTDFYGPPVEMKGDEAYNWSQENIKKWMDNNFIECISNVIYTIDNPVPSQSCGISLSLSPMTHDFKTINDFCKKFSSADGSARIDMDSDKTASINAEDSENEFSNKLAIAMAGKGSEFVIGGGAGNYGRIHGLGSINTSGGLGKKRERIVGKIALGSGSTTGYCDKSSIEQVVRRRADAFRACYEEQLQTHPSNEGKITVRWTISTDGTVQDAKILQSSIGNNTIDNCVLRSIRVMRFKHEDGTCIVQWPFVFSSEGELSAPSYNTDSKKVNLNDLLRQSATPRIDDKLYNSEISCRFWSI